jgi:hypothetical protein
MRVALHQLRNNAVLGRPEQRALYGHKEEHAQQQPRIAQPERHRSGQHDRDFQHFGGQTTMSRLLKRSASSPASGVNSRNGRANSRLASPAIPPAVGPAAAAIRKLINSNLNTLSFNAPKNWVALSQRKERPSSYAFIILSG